MSALWARTAARNNAAWCDAVCRAHGLPGEFTAGAWVNPRRTPAGYPDAVTLDTASTAAHVVSWLDAAPGCSIQDSFRDLDLAGYGFRVLHDARWLFRSPEHDLPPEPAELSWSTVTSREELVSWGHARAGGDAEQALRPGLLADPTVQILAGYRDGRMCCGAVLNRSDGPAVGVSNVFTLHGRPADTWSGLVNVASRHFPGIPLVGYEDGEALHLALGQAFEDIGGLRVWLRATDSPPPLGHADTGEAGSHTEPSSVFAIRPIVDDQELHALFAESWPHSRTVGFRRQLEQHSLTWITARRDGRLVGFANVAWDGGEHAFLLDTTVRPAARRQGLGRELVRRVAEAARDAGITWLHVDHPQHLEDFYRGCGFQPTPAGVLRLN